MTKVLQIAKPYGLKVRKKWGRSSEYGRGMFGDNLYANDGGGSLAVGVTIDKGYGIYQQKLCKEGKITCKEKFYEPTQTWSAAKEAAQVKFSAAVAAYKILTIEQKKVYHTRAVGKHYSGYNLFIIEYLASH